MTTQNEKQTITVDVLPDISKSKDNKTMKFSQSIEYNRPSARSFTLRGHTFLKKGQLQCSLKQLSLEQDRGHNTR